ncbi:MAG TPA: type I restriction endonuclease, partial [Nitrosomonas halophila]|nr:type I restriction endonuclease [Nitrosomonas halophila]
MITEQQLEDAAIGWFGELGWHHASGPAIAPDGDQPARSDYRQVVLREHLLAALARINPQIPAAALDQAAHELLTVSEPLLIARNRRVHRLLLSGIPVEFSIGDEKRTDLVNLIDFANPRNNDFLLVSQFTVSGTKQP